MPSQLGGFLDVKEETDTRSESVRIANVRKS